VKKVLLPGILLILLGCAASYTRTMTPVLQELNQGPPDRAVARLREVFPDTTGRNRLLYLMELGNLARYSNQHYLAQQALLQADRISDLQRGVDLAGQAQAMLTSDLALEFRGADYEKVFINYCLAASFASAGNIESAVVEARRVNEKLKEINTHYGENPNRYTDDAFVRYFMGVLYEMDQDWDDALVSYRLAMAAYDSVYARDYGLGAPAQLRADAMRLAHWNGFDSLLEQFTNLWPEIDYRSSGPNADWGEVVAVFELGNISQREERDFTVYSEDRVYRMSLPVIPDFPRRTVNGSIFVGDHSGQFFLVQDMNGIARKNLEDHAARDVLRAAARLAVKAGVSELGENLTEQLTGDSNVGSGVGLILSIFGAVTERADLRAWLTLPAQIHMARLRVPPGDWPVSFRVSGRMQTAESVSVRSGEITLVFLRGDMGYGPGRIL
jgi:uncharacterized protein